ncbi:MAG TPA: 2-C-methyl-D-erythritol 4-phosphate cytidylyltransferase [Longimicrobiaceae bacterium]|nr:2-C-methyl-D-erythritol 4-phosphate cytidylyltransferase [Longimicrobiaceae bacterium]
MSPRSYSSSSLDQLMATGVVVLAGGAGRRMGGNVRKQYLTLAGEPVLKWALRPFLEHPGIDTLVLVLPRSDLEEPPAWISSFGLTTVAGGAERGESVWNGLSALPGSIDTVLIHDGARPLVDREVIDRVLAWAGTGAAVAGVRVSDTIKVADSAGVVTKTLDRSGLWRAQTPQGFPLPVIREVYRRARAQGVSATDDSALCEHFGIDVQMVDGSPDNLKITRPVDLMVAESIVKRMRGQGEGGMTGCRRRV